MTPEQRFRYADERFADLQMLRYQVRGFEHLSLRQKKLIYFLAEAALTGRDILWDQNGRYNLRIRRLLEAVYTDYPGDRTTPDFLAFETYLKRVWFSNGIHHHYSCDKFRPAFSPDFLRNALKVIHYNPPTQQPPHSAPLTAVRPPSMPSAMSSSPLSLTPQSSPSVSIKPSAKTSSKPALPTTTPPISPRKKPKPSTNR